MAVISINKIFDKVQAKCLPRSKVPLVVIAAEMQMFPINQVITRGWPLLHAILKPGPKATLKALVTPSKWAPSFGPGPSPSKKAKASISKSRPKTPSVTQKEKFGIDVRVTPSDSIKASALNLIATLVNLLLDTQPGPSSDLKDQIIKALKVHVASLEKQVERIPDLELQLSSLA
ncbi:hypothetical protein PAXRUDRAFT_13714 [Paxillus rubicundulus Ve08.2h10]|uniref:Uncharacterized protein n=1 Tax=Paxillus rubicundulus Ve08.2h10 TaxID=930991 RepID=A0A0D0E3F6_9AGAM|nr:hypothetical protein PAXRUDRAFT_13714 [Paxillus rubicundulus Ve08.2h10]